MVRGAKAASATTVVKLNDNVFRRHLRQTALQERFLMLPVVPFLQKKENTSWACKQLQYSKSNAAEVTIKVKIW